MMANTLYMSDMEWFMPGSEPRIKLNFNGVMMDPYNAYLNHEIDGKHLAYV
jgi:hypothetical protein